MINISLFLKQNQSEILEIISKLEKAFSSHHFIEKFSQQFEEVYIEMLTKYKKNGNSFQKVNAQIGKYLSINMDVLLITKESKRKSKTVFGTFDKVQWWIKK